MRKVFLSFLLFCILLYRKLISPWFGTGKCRYIPSCSEYAEEALKQYGIVIGLYLSVKRILRCNPLGGYGYDPLPGRDELGKCKLGRLIKF